MKIEINGSNNPTEDMQVYCEGKRISQPTNGIFSHYWDESDLCKILTEKQIKELEEGKYIFNIPTWKVRLLQCKRAAKDNNELRFLMQWS